MKNSQWFWFALLNSEERVKKGKSLLSFLYIHGEQCEKAEKSFCHSLHVQRLRKECVSCFSLSSKLTHPWVWHEEGGHSQRKESEERIVEEGGVGGRKDRNEGRKTVSSSSCPVARSFHPLRRQKAGGRREVLGHSLSYAVSQLNYNV